MAAAVAACGGGSASTSPTPVVQVPTTSAVQWQVLGGISVNNVAGLDQWLQGTANPGNLLIAECLVDGVLQNRLTVDPQSQGLPIGLSCVFPVSMQSGRHTLTAKIVSQVKSPNVYNVQGGSVIANRGAETLALDCPSSAPSLANGAEVSCSITLP